MSHATEHYPLAGNTTEEDFPTPLEAAHKGLNPDPEPLETGLSDMPELPELTHHAEVLAAIEAEEEAPDAPMTFAEKAKAAANKPNGAPATEVKKPTSRDVKAPASVVVPTPVATSKTEKAQKVIDEKVAPKYAEVAASAHETSDKLKKKTKSAAHSAKVKAGELEEELKEETRGRGWPATLSEAWEKYWLVGSIVGAAAVVVGVTVAVRTRADWTAVLRRK